MNGLGEKGWLVQVVGTTLYFKRKREKK